MTPYYERHGSIGYMNYFPDVSTPGFDFKDYNQRFHNANIIIDGRTKSMSYDLHWGPLSIKGAAGGSEFYKSGDALYRVDDNCVLLFNEGKYYQSWIDEPREVESFTLNMTPAFEQTALLALKSARTGCIEGHCFANKVRFTERLYHYSPTLLNLLTTIRNLARDLHTHHGGVQELFFAVYLEMIALQETSDREALATGKMRATSRQELYRRLLIAKDFIHSCFDADVTLDHIADVACLNPYYLLREFKRTFRLTPHQYLTNLRISKAERLLITCHDGVESVCQAVGFHDPSSFGKLFRRKTGYSPSEYRARKMQPD